MNKGYDEMTKIMKDLNDWSKADFLNVPNREWNEDIGEFDSLIIIPMELSLIQIIKYKILAWLNRKITWFDSYYFPDGLHDSGYRCMDFVAVKNNEPLCRLSGCSDVIHLDGIGGYGKNWINKYAGVPELVEPRDWNIDCLRKSGLLRLFGGKLTCGPSLSSFEVYTNK